MLADPPEVARAKGLVMVLWLGIGGFALVTLLVALWAARRYRFGRARIRDGRRRRSTPDPWFEAGRRLEVPPRTDAGEGEAGGDIDAGGGEGGGNGARND